MTIQEVLSLVDYYKENSLILFLEGNFRKCYNQHTHYFIENVAKMKVHTRWYKNVNRYAHTIGFPNTVLEKYIQRLEGEFSAKVVEELPKYIRLSNIKWNIQNNYALWNDERISQYLQKEENKVEKVENNMEQEQYKNIIKVLSTFDVNNATPLQALNFIAKIKSELIKC